MSLAPAPSSPFRGSLTWPILFITLGGMLLVGEVVPRLGLGKTWPVLLLVIGVVKLIEAGRPPRPPAGPRA